MKKHTNKIITGVILAILLVFVFWYGGDAPSLRGWTPEPNQDAVVVQNSEPAKEELAGTEKTISDISVKEENTLATEENKPQKKDGTLMTPAEKIAMEEKMAENTQLPAEEVASSASLPKEKPTPIEPEQVVITDKEHTCTLSVRCDTILNNIGWLQSEQVDLVPKDGVIYAEKTVTFYEGESVFNLLAREMKRNKIHLEFENVPIYNSAYIEGIANLYEFDCGEISGWMYKVNGWFPNYGCSRYQLKPGDIVEFLYTCDLGRDVGGHYAARNGRES